MRPTGAPVRSMLCARVTRHCVRYSTGGTPTTAAKREANVFARQPCRRREGAERPRLPGRLVHRHERSGERRVRQAGEQARGQPHPAGVVEDPAEEPHEHHLEQAVDDHPLTAARGVDLREEQVQCGPEGRHRLERNDHHGRQGREERMRRSVLDVEGRAGEVGLLRRGVVEGVLEGRG